MDQSTQENATMVEESTAASHSLTQEMGELTKLVEQFRVDEPAEERMRRDLKAVAPHAFAKPPAPHPAPHSAPHPAPKPALHAAAKPAKPAAHEPPRPAKAAAGARAASADWAEF